jgi:hypothetical protein
MSPKKDSNLETPPKLVLEHATQGILRLYKQAGGGLMEAHIPQKSTMPGFSRYFIT